MKSIPSIPSIPNPPETRIFHDPKNQLATS